MSVDAMASHSSRLPPAARPQIRPSLAVASAGCNAFFGGGAGLLKPTRRCCLHLVKADSDGKPPPISFGDRLLDYIEGGPKLRKWYGAPDRLPKDGGNSDDTDLDEQGDREVDEGRGDAVLVTDADSDTGQLIVLLLILKRARVKALVKDRKAAIIAFGSYVEPVVGDVSDKLSLKKALSGVRSVVCPTRVGALGDPLLLTGVQHIVFLSQLSVFRDDGGLRSFFSQGSRYQVEQDEGAVGRSGIPHTIIRAGSLRDEPGGQLGFSVGQDGKVKGSISREDAAKICVKALEAPPQQSLLFEVANGDEEIQDWEALFSSLSENAVV